MFFEELERKVAEKDEEKSKKFRESLKANKVENQKINDYISNLIRKTGEKVVAEKKAAMKEQIEKEKQQSERRIKEEYEKKYGIKNKEKEEKDSLYKKMLSSMLQAEKNMNG